MKTRGWRLAAACVLMATSAAAEAAPGYSYLDVDFVSLKPDNAYTSNGSDLAASFGIGSNAYLALGYQSVSIQPFGVSKGTTYGFHDQLLEFGGHTNGEHVDLLFGINYQSRTFPSQFAFFDPTSTISDSGMGPTLGLRFHPSERFDIDTIIRSTNFSDSGSLTQGQIRFAFRITDLVGLNGSYLVDDKYTGFMLGLSLNF